MSTFHVMYKTSEVIVFLSVFFGSIPCHPANKIYSARSTILVSVSPFACGSRVISRDSPKRESLLADYLMTFIR